MATHTHLSNLFFFEVLEVGLDTLAEVEQVVDIHSVEVVGRAVLDIEEDKVAFLLDKDAVNIGADIARVFGVVSAVVDDGQVLVVKLGVELNGLVLLLTQHLSKVCFSGLASLAAPLVVLLCNSVEVFLGLFHNLICF